MKKLFAMLLALAMLLGCALAEATFDYSGWWTLTGVTAAGVTLDSAKMSMEADMALYEDGTCHLYAQDEVQSGVWTVIEGGIAVTSEYNDTMNYLLTEDGSLTIELDGITLIFTPSVYAEPLCGLTMTDFAGDWTFMYLEYLGELVYPDEFGMNVSLQLSEAGGHVEIVEESSTEAHDLVCEIEEVEDFATVLNCLAVDPETGEQNGQGMALMMFSNGELIWYMEDLEQNPMYFCFAPAEE